MYVPLLSPVFKIGEPLSSQMLTIEIPWQTASAASASGFLLVSLSKTPRPSFPPFEHLFLRRGVSD
jgi:hypothetical protein